MAENKEEKEAPPLEEEQPVEKPLTFRERLAGKRDESTVALKEATPASTTEVAPPVGEMTPASVTEEQARGAVLTWAKDFYGSDKVEVKHLAYDGTVADWTAELAVAPDVTASVTFLLDDVHGLYVQTIDGEPAAAVIARDRRPRGEDGKLLSSEERLALLEARFDRFERKHGAALEPISG